MRNFYQRNCGLATVRLAIAARTETASRAFAALFAAALVVTLWAALANAAPVKSQQPPPQVVEAPSAAAPTASIAPGTFEFGVDTAPEGMYVFPTGSSLGGPVGGKGAWGLLPMNSAMPSGPGVPASFTMKVTIQIKDGAWAGKANGFPPVIGRYRGIVASREKWAETVGMATEPTWFAAAAIVLESVTVQKDGQPGHIYVAQVIVDGQPPSNEVVLPLDADGKSSVAKEVTLRFVHLPVAVDTTPPVPR